MKSEEISILIFITLSTFKNEFNYNVPFNTIDLNGIPFNLSLSSLTFNSIQLSAGTPFSTTSNIALKTVVWFNEALNSLWFHSITLSSTVFIQLNIEVTGTQ